MATTTGETLVEFLSSAKVDIRTGFSLLSNLIATIATAFPLTGTSVSGFGGKVSGMTLIATASTLAFMLGVHRAMGSSRSLSLSPSPSHTLNLNPLFRLRNSRKLHAASTVPPKKIVNMDAGKV